MRPSARSRRRPDRGRGARACGSAGGRPTRPPRPSGRRRAAGRPPGSDGRLPGALRTRNGRARGAEDRRVRHRSRIPARRSSPPGLPQSCAMARPSRPSASISCAASERSAACRSAPRRLMRRSWLPSLSSGHAVRQAGGEVALVGGQRQRPPTCSRQTTAARSLRAGSSRTARSAPTPSADVPTHRAGSSKPPDHTAPGHPARAGSASTTFPRAGGRPCRRKPGRARRSGAGSPGSCGRPPSDAADLTRSTVDRSLDLLVGVRGRRHEGAVESPSVPGEVDRGAGRRPSPRGPARARPRAPHPAGGRRCRSRRPGRLAAPSRRCPRAASRRTAGPRCDDRSGIRQGDEGAADRSRGDFAVVPERLVTWPT